MAKTRITSQDVGDTQIQTADVADDAITLAKLGALTTKGDLLGFASDHVRIPVGTNGHALFADSANANGILWRAIVAGDVGSGDALTKTDDTNVTLTLGGTPSSALLAAASLTLGWTGQLSIARGGTSGATATAAFNALSPVTTRGDLIVRDATNNVRLAIGTADQVLKTNGTDPAWGKLVRANTNANTGTGDTFVFAASPTFTDAAPGSGVSALKGIGLDLTGTLAGVGYVLEILPAGLTVGGGGSPQAALEPIRWDSTITLSSTSAFGPSVTIGDVPTYTNSANVIAGNFIGKTFRPTITAATALTFTFAANNGLIGEYVGPILGRGGTGTGTLPFITGLYMAPILNDGWTVDDVRAVHVVNATDAGNSTIAEQGGIDIESLTFGTLNYSLRSVGAQYLFHEGNVRLGDTTVPTKKLEVLSASNTTAMTVDLSGTITGILSAIQLLPAGITISTGAVFGVNSTGIITVAGAPSVVGTSLFYSDALTIQNDGTARTLTGVNSFTSTPTYKAVMNALTMNNGVLGAPACASFTAQPTWSRTGTPTQTAAQFVGFALLPGTIGAGWTVTDYRGFHFRPPTVTGAVTTMVGVDVEKPNGSTSIGIRNAGTNVYPPTVGTITAVGSTIPHTASVIRLDNTSGGALTLTSAPTISDGVDGETVLIFNGSAQNVVIQDQGTLASSNLRLSTATYTLSTRDSILLMYSSTVGDWIEIARTNVV